MAHYGEIGKRVYLRLTLMNVYHYFKPHPFYRGRDIEAEILKFSDEDGNTFVCYTSSVLGIETVGDNNECYFDPVNKNDTCIVKATIKDHREYKGELQTVINRVKVCEIDHAPTEEELAELQMKSLKDGDVVKKVTYRDYKTKYSDCEKVIGSYEVEFGKSYITIIIRNGYTIKG